MATHRVATRFPASTGAASGGRRARRSLLPWLLAVLLLAALPVWADSFAVESAPAGPLGRWASVLVEGDRPLAADEALAQLRRGAFHPADAEVPKFGIGASPVWLHLAVSNGAPRPVARRLLLGVSWLDRVDVHLVRGDRIARQWSAGDGDPALQRPLGSIGYVLAHDFEPGLTEILVRVETADPMVVPLRLLDPEAANARTRLHDYGYGLLYGFLFALIGYNGMLYAGLRERSHLDYALYLMTFVLLSASYSGHGYAWLWPGASGLQRYVILVLMVLAGAAGLRFARRFLGLADISPRVDRAVGNFSAVGLAAIGLCVLAQWQAAAALVAFVFVLLFSVTMLALGLLCVRRGETAARYFLAGAAVAMAGFAVTALAVWKGLPFNDFLFHAAEGGLALEGTLLALALAYRMRRIQNAQAVAEQLSRTDPLTGLLNRRAFLELGEAAWSTAVRKERPLSVILLDLDHFKAINDGFGHEAGDKVLVAVSAVLDANCRRGDIAARWGGEEFIVLLPETDAAQARVLAERLLGDIRAARVHANLQTLQLTASLGVADRMGQQSLQELIRDADRWMYLSKEGGRGRVSGPRTSEPANRRPESSTTDYEG